LWILLWILLYAYSLLYNKSTTNRTSGVRPQKGSTELGIHIRPVFTRGVWTGARDTARKHGCLILHLCSRTVFTAPVNADSVYRELYGAFTPPRVHEMNRIGWFRSVQLSQCEHVFIQSFVGNDRLRRHGHESNLRISSTPHFVACTVMTQS